jgi:hypothetical protein
MTTQAITKANGARRIMTNIFGHDRLAVSSLMPSF